MSLVRYVIIDDFISSGATIKRIMYVMGRNFKGSECVGIILYEAQYETKFEKGIPVIPVWTDIDDLRHMKVQS